jgi:hypothetical protein
LPPIIDNFIEPLSTVHSMNSHQLKLMQVQAMLSCFIPDRRASTRSNLTWSILSIDEGMKRPERAFMGAAALLTVQIPRNSREGQDVAHWGVGDGQRLQTKISSNCDAVSLQRAFCTYELGVCS